jgi:hypothetical protein
MGRGCVVDDTTRVALAVPISALVFNVFIVVALIWISYRQRVILRISERSLVCVEYKPLTSGSSLRRCDCTDDDDSTYLAETDIRNWHPVSTYPIFMIYECLSQIRFFIVCTKRLC